MDSLRLSGLCYKLSFESKTQTSEPETSCVGKDIKGVAKKGGV
jgi:hypothetical protein